MQSRPTTEETGRRKHQRRRSYDLKLDDAGCKQPSRFQQRKKTGDRFCCRYFVLAFVSSLVTIWSVAALLVLHDSTATDGGSGWRSPSILLQFGGSEGRINNSSINVKNRAAPRPFHRHDSTSSEEVQRQHAQIPKIVDNSPRRAFGGATSDSKGDDDHRPRQADGNKEEALDSLRPEPTENHDAFDKEGAFSATTLQAMDTAVLLFTCQRAAYLTRALEYVWKYHPVHNGRQSLLLKDGTVQQQQQHSEKNTKPSLGGGALPIIVSQDGNDADVSRVVAEYRLKFHSVRVPLVHLMHTRQKAGQLRGTDAYAALSEHYGWALNLTFSGEAYRMIHEPNSTRADQDIPSLLLHQRLLPISMPKRVIILEEDIQIGADFFSYMSATASLLDSDPTLLAVSAFNDNGKTGLVGDARRLLRSDFFPGLGWMMNRKLWDELGPKWPHAFWDDWLREPEQRKGRHTIRPEICRTLHFGAKGGASVNQFGKHLNLIQISDETDIVDWSTQDLSYLQNDVFRSMYWKNVTDAKHVTVVEDAMQHVKDGPVRVEYKSWNMFQSIARQWMLMDNEKAGIPRTAYEGIVEFRPYGPGGHLLYLTPPMTG